MVIIDAQAYVGESIYLKKKFTDDDLIKRMDANGIDMAVVTAPPPARAQDYQEANKIIYEATKKYPDRLIGLYKVNPWFRNAELERAETAIKDWEFKGIKLNPFHESFNVIKYNPQKEASYVVNPIVKAVMDLASRLEVPVFFHTGDSTFCPPESILFIAALYPKVTVMTRHTLLGLLLASHQCLSKDLENIVFGTYPLKGGGPKGIDKFLKLIPIGIGVNRIVFTTETPFGHPEFELKVIERTNLDTKIKNLIMSTNIKNIINI
mgnify:CR=1 FL=1